MALAIDASTPAITSGSTAAITSAAFTTPANVLLVALVGRDSASSGVDSTGTVSGAGLAWTLAGRKSSVGATGQVSGGTAQPGCAEIWWAYSSTALTSVTVTDTRTSGADDHAMQVVVITGAESTWGGAIAANGAASGLPTATLTTTAAGSLVLSCSTDWSARGNATAGAGQTIISQFHLATQISIHFWRQTNTAASSGASVTNNLTAPTGEQYNMLAIEVREAPGGGTAFTGSASLSGSGALTNAGTPAASGSRSLTGAGTVAGAGSPATSGSESSTGAGSLTFGANPGFSGPFSPSGSGTLTLSGAAVYVGSAALSGAGSVTLGGTPKAVNSTAPSGAGTLALGGSPAATGGGSLTGSGTLTLSGTPGGGGGPEAHSGLVMLTGDGGLSAAGAPAPTGTLSLGGAGFITLSAAGRTMYQFDPPGKQLPMDPTGRDFLWSKVSFFRGDAVVRYTTGAFKQVTTHDPDEAGIDKVYLGGHTYTVDDGTAAELIQAGYGPYLKVVVA